MNKLTRSCCCFAAALGLIGPNLAGQNPSDPLYRDAKIPVSERVRDLLSRMTIEEKVAQLECATNKPVVPGMRLESALEGDHLNETLLKKVFANGMGTYAFMDEFAGMSGDAHSGADHRNLLQTWVLKNTRLGIPIMFHGEALHGAMVKGATSFPEAVALGSTWDPPLLEQMFSTVAIEERALGNTLVLAPVFDLSRDPRYGRVEEMYSEDPYLVAQLGVAAVRGFQGNEDTLDENHVFATAKHFVHGQPENGTNGGPSDYSEHTMRSIFLYPFEHAVKDGHIEAVMPSYNETLGGLPSSANPWLLKEVLRKEWGFTGLTVSDYTAIEELNTVQGMAPDKAAAGVLAFRSGVDMELPEPSTYPSLVEAVKKGKISEAELNESVGRVLTAKLNAGLFEHPFVDTGRADRDVATSDHIKLARKVADEAVVLLKNQNRLLPLDPASIKTLAVIGPNANKERLGGYSGLPASYVTVLDGIKKRIGEGTKVVYAEGCRISEPDTAPNSNEFLPYKAPSVERDRELIDEAVETAKHADVVVLALGGNENVSREATTNELKGDTDTLELPGRQDELVDRIAKLGKPMVAVLLNGRAYTIESLSRQVPAIVEGWYLGQETGDAIADILFGDVNPSGRLPVTIARNVGQLPVFYYKMPKSRFGYVFSDNSPLYPFGFGLSYTTFNFGKPTVDHSTIGRNGTAKVSVTVINAGRRAGDEVVQLYVHHPVSSIAQPIILLRGFKRIHLEPGQSTDVKFEIGPEQLSILNAQMERVVEPGPVDLLIGANSAETAKTAIVVTE
jgi:beta-glucosidase-like glycosyl hydrolase